MLIGGHMEEVGSLIESEIGTALQNLNRFLNTEIWIRESRLARFGDGAWSEVEFSSPELFELRQLSDDLFELASSAGSCFGKGNHSHGQLELFLDML